MVLLNRLETFAEHQGLFSNMQFCFKEGVGCTEALFTILESINHMLERGIKVFGCFLDVRKAFDTVWIDGLLLKLCSEFGIKERTLVLMRKLRSSTRAHCEGSSIFCRVLARGEFLLRSCTKCTLTAF